MPDSIQHPDTYPQRLCNEIQLFDLCDLDSCRKRSGRYCTDSEMLGRFENIAEKELRVSERSISGELDDTETDDGEYSDGYDEDDGFSEEYIEDGEDESGEEL